MFTSNTIPSPLWRVNDVDEAQFYQVSFYAWIRISDFLSYHSFPFLFQHTTAQLNNQDSLTSPVQDRNQKHWKECKKNHIRNSVMYANKIFLSLFWVDYYGVSQKESFVESEDRLADI